MAHPTAQQLPLPGLSDEGRTSVRRARPFVKWAGGKTRLLSALLQRLPTRFGRYFEPFVGGGALFFRLQPREAILADINEDLTQLYETVRDTPEELILELANYHYEKTFYYEVRSRDPGTLSPIQRSARMLYLNRTCFNGLYRVNKKGRFNVPFGRYTNPTICDADGLRAASSVLLGRPIFQAAYGAAVSGAKAGDFVYFDPPYHPVSTTSRFTQYTRYGFRAENQRELAEVFADLTRRGVSCMLTNSDCEFVRELYTGYEVDRVEVARSISRAANRRGRVGELIIRNYT